MKRNLLLIPILMFSVAAVAADKGSVAAAFDRLKTLAGSWQTTASDGKTYTNTWQPVSGGSVMMERMQSDDMVTMYHMDGARLMMTHYCGARNQPRMVAEVSPDGKSIAFNFLDITNLASPQAGHMRRMVLTFEDENHISEQWVYREKGKDVSEVFRLTRKN